mmetsp:Transcript_1483/g.3564  ORF Transcript_1483/g.3564 Transcript_1483/m.3564 type:complete len:220 (-) Transcript_1483:1203-1862(-)
MPKSNAGSRALLTSSGLGRWLRARWATSSSAASAGGSASVSTSAWSSSRHLLSSFWTNRRLASTQPPPARSSRCSSASPGTAAPSSCRSTSPASRSLTCLTPSRSSPTATLSTTGPRTESSHTFPRLASRAASTTTPPTTFSTSCRGGRSRTGSWTRQSTATTWASASGASGPFRSACGPRTCSHPSGGGPWSIFSTSGRTGTPQCRGTTIRGHTQLRG